MKKIGLIILDNGRWQLTVSVTSNGQWTEFHNPKEHSPLKTQRAKDRERIKYTHYREIFFLFLTHFLFRRIYMIGGGGAGSFSQMSYFILGTTICAIKYTTTFTESLHLLVVVNENVYLNNFLYLHLNFIANDTFFFFFFWEFNIYTSQGLSLNFIGLSWPVECSIFNSISIHQTATI